MNTEKKKKSFTSFFKFVLEIKESWDARNDGTCAIIPIKWLTFNL